MSDINAVETTPTGGDTSAPAASTTATPQAEPQAPATGAAPGQPDPAWLRSRFDEVRQSARKEAQSQFNDQYSKAQAEIENYKRQVQALVGVNPPSPQDAQVNQIKEQFFQVFPQAKAILENSEKIQQLLERTGDYDAVIDQTWRSYGRQATDRLFSKATEALGQPLDDSGKAWLHKQFVNYVQGSPENYERYQQDPTIVDDFVKEISGFVSPLRRAATAGIPARASVPLPQDTRGGAPPPAGPTPPKDLDEMVARGWAQYESTKRGGQ